MRFGLLLLLGIALVIYLVFKLLAPGNFGAPANLSSYAQQCIIQAVAACGFYFIMTMGLFDFSLGSNIILSAIIGSLCSVQFGYAGLIIGAVLCGALIGFICGFIGAGGGMMMLLILTSVMGYELKTAVGTSVFIMTFTALTGAVSHFVIGGLPNILVWVLCVIFTLVWARIAAVVANKAEPKTLNRATGVVLVVLGAVIMGFKLLQ